MLTSASAGPFIAFEHIGVGTNWNGQMADDCRSEVGLVVENAPVLPPGGELHRTPAPSGCREPHTRLGPSDACLATTGSSALTGPQGARFSATRAQDGRFSVCFELPKHAKTGGYGA